MALIQWSNDLSVHIKEIDAQHKKLIQLINTLHDFMAMGKAKDVMGQTLAELVDYTVYHFSTEERLFQQHGYPGYAEHKAQHDELTRQAKELKAKFDKGDALITLDVMNFLVDWLNKHIIGSDKLYTSFLNKKGVF